MKKKKKLSHEVVCVEMLDFEISNSKYEVSKSNSWKMSPFPEHYVTSEGAVSHSVLYYTKPIVSTALTNTNNDTTKFP